MSISTTPLTFPLDGGTYGNDITRAIRPHHQQLRHHGISDEVIVGRGYGSLSNDARGDIWKSQHGFIGAQSLLGEALIVPTFGLKGQSTGCTLVLDCPRRDARGYPIPYEHGDNFLPTIDLHPLTHERIGNFGPPWFYTTNYFHSDALVSMGHVAFTLNEGLGEDFQSLKSREIHRLALEFEGEMAPEIAGRTHVFLFDSIPGFPLERANLLSCLARVLQQRQSDVVMVHPWDLEGQHREHGLPIWPRVQDIFGRLSNLGFMGFNDGDGKPTIS